MLGTEIDGSAWNIVTTISPAVLLFVPAMSNELDLDEQNKAGVAGKEAKRLTLGDIHPVGSG